MSGARAKLLGRGATALCAAAAIAAVPARLAAQRADRVTLTHAEIEAGGWQRVSEVLDAAGGWRITSTDGFTITPTADGLPAAGESATGSPMVAIIVDGARVPVTMFGTQELEFLPINLAQIDSITISSDPQLIAGRIEMRGVLQFFSHRPSPGATAQGVFEVGDVANKPGLYQYTPMRPPNREHVGPFWGWLFGYGGSRVGFEAGIRYATLNTTDSLLLNQTNVGATGGTAQINLPDPTAHLDVLAFGGRHSFDAGRAHYSGLFFVPALGHNQSLRMNATTFTAAGNAALPASLGFDYRAAYVTDDVTPLPSGYPTTLTERRRNLNGGVDVTRAIGDLRATLGVDADHWALDRVPSGTQGSRDEQRLSARLEGPSDQRWANSLAGVYTHANGVSEAGGVVSSRFEASPADQFVLAAAATAQSPGEDGAWIDPAAIGVAAPSVVQRLAGVDVGWTHRLSRRLALLTGADYHHVSGWPIAQPSDTGFFELAGEPPPPPIQGTVDVAGARIGVEVPRTNRWYARLLYSYSRPVGGDSALQTATRTIARHQLAGQAWLVPAQDWRISTIVQLLSPTYWSAFPALAHGWPPTVEPMQRIDLSAEKWMWSRHVRFQYLVRDALNGVERWQPRSAEFNLRWLAAVSFVAGARD